VKRFILLLILLHYLGVGSVSYAQADKLKLSSTEIKISYLVNFARYIHWPESAFTSASAPLVIAVAQSHPFASQLDNRVVGQTKGGRDIRFRAVSQVPPFESIQVLFIESESRLLAAINKEAINAPVLTVGDSNDFFETGGVIQLEERDKNIIFFINRERAEALGLNIHYKLLKMAKDYNARQSYD